MKILFADNKRKIKKFVDISIFNKDDEIWYDGAKLYKKKKDFFLNFDAYFYSIYHSPVSIIVAAKCLSGGVNVGFLSDGIWDMANAYKNPFTAKNKLTLYNPLIAGILYIMGQDEKEYFEYFGLKTKSYLPKRAFVRESSLAPKRDKSFLITTGNTPFFDNKEKEVVISVINKLCNEIASNGGKIYTRIYEKDILDKIDFSVSNLINCCFNDALLMVESVISTQSTILIPSMYYKRKVALILYRNFPISVQPGWILVPGFEKELIRSMTENSKERLDYQNWVVSKYVGNNIDSLKRKDIEELVQSEPVLGKEHYRAIEKFLDSNAMRMINSPFNINIEAYARKMYEFIKK